jgi:thiamine-phosphate pyrophosphorylase
VSPVLPRLYAILDLDLLDSRGFAPVEVLDAWLDAGIRLVQLRAKSLALGPFLEIADGFTARARQAGATCVINDRVDVARLCDADGVHVGQDDLRPSDARALLGPSKIVGLSTHNDTQVRAAIGEPVSYLAIGPVFATSSKARPDPVVGLEGVRRARELCAASGLPLVAIGGITIGTASSVIEAGASSVAIISDLMAPDVPGRAHAWIEALR